MNVQLEIPGTSPFELTGKHFHIGANMVGYLPESDVFCADNVQDAVEFFLSRVQEARDEAEDMCCEIGNGHVGCEWRQLADEIEKIQALGAENCQKLQAKVLSSGGHSYMYCPPEGADIHYWIEPQSNNKTDALMGVFSKVSECEIWKEQES